MWTFLCMNEFISVNFLSKKLHYFFMKVVQKKRMNEFRKQFSRIFATVLFLRSLSSSDSRVKILSRKWQKKAKKFLCSTTSIIVTNSSQKSVFRLLKLYLHKRQRYPPRTQFLAGDGAVWVSVNTPTPTQRCRLAKILVPGSQLSRLGSST